MTTMIKTAAEGVGSQMRDTRVIVKRNLLRIIRLPQLLFFSSVQPIIFLLLFTYVFGGAITSGTSIPRGSGSKRWRKPFGPTPLTRSIRWIRPGTRRRSNARCRTPAKVTPPWRPDTKTNALPSSEDGL